MKKTLLTILLLVAAITGATAQNDAMYIYRNDGVINAFLKVDVDSMRCSQMDLDSLVHSEYVVQEVWTADSVYRIPLAAIDSISFVTPKTVYQPGTVNITAEMREYVVSSDSLLLVFADNTPQMLLPEVGDKLVNTEASGGLIRGFLGKVTEIEKTPEGYAVKCAPIDITDVFECYYSISHGRQQQKTRGLNVDVYYPLGFVWEPGKITVPLLRIFGTEISYEGDGNLLIPSVQDAECSVSLTPRLESRSYLIVNEDYGVNLSVSLYGDYTLEEDLSLAGSLGGGGDLKLFDQLIFPIPEILCDFAIEGGVFLKGEIQISTEQKWKQRYKSIFQWDHSSKGSNSLKQVNKIWNVENTHSGIMAIKGIYETGLYFNVNLALLGTHLLDISEIGIRGEGGLHFEGTALPYLSNKENAMRNPELYEMMKGQGVELSLYYGVSADAKLFGWAGNKPLPNFLGIPFGKKWVWKSCYYVPEFKNTKLRRDSDGNYFASVDISGNSDETDIGFSLQSKDSYIDRIDGYCAYDYTGPSTSAYSTFYSKPSKGPVIVYPLVKFGDLEMIASPSAELPKAHPMIVDFKVTDSEYSKGKFMNDGMVYDYKFDVAVSAEIDNLDGVADWGYVYKGPNGNIKRISLMQYGKSYTDTRYAYYRNEAKSTACLYTYVRYEGDSDYMDDEPKYYPLEIAIQVHTCPDDNHPHAIDLGLPSGTKWSCSNVGASVPEEYGGYYSWGETSEKDVYSFDNYEFREGLDYINIGSEISDTQYDVACVRMGTPWRMPTEELQGELLQNCTKQWTQYNGVNGTLVTGPNGNNIFLPASGGRWGKNLKEAGERGTYRSGTLHSSHPYMVNGIFIDKDGCGWNGGGPETGYPVRAVCP